MTDGISDTFTIPSKIAFKSQEKKIVINYPLQDKIIFIIQAICILTAEQDCHNTFVLCTVKT